MSDLLRLQDALIKAQRWHEAKTITATIKTIEALQAEVEELTADLVRVRRYLDRERKTARESIERLRNFVEVVEGALGCTDGDDIRTHIEPELAALKQEDE